ncbi:MAG: coproporphyrinogen III oxidase, partial [Rhizobiales bacterium]|nr:coproporphyrinogen III oxidase [Hyphomicrobiales bacterium]
IDLCVEMLPDRIALFGYAHVPWMAKNQRLIDEDALPNSQARLKQASAAAKKLETLGYQPIGLDHFARPNDILSRALKSGKIRRNFQGYTTDNAETIVGLGATSIGRTPFGYIQNIAETGAWARAVEQGVLPIAKGCDLTPDDKLRAEIIERIMCYGMVDLKAVTDAHNAPENWCESNTGKLNSLSDDGLLEIDDGVLRLTQAGLPLSRVVAAAFDAYRTNNSGKHSLAI